MPVNPYEPPRAEPPEAEPEEPFRWEWIALGIVVIIPLLTSIYFWMMYHGHWGRR